ncbi:MAG: site-2 protease family protein [Pyrinomonadaceae bacterium]|nr:site-2 protease family protein [Pyrinomonadaceae bacterium]
MDVTRKPLLNYRRHYPVAGIVIASPEVDVPPLPLSSVIDYLVFLPQYYLRSVSALLGFTEQHPHLLAEGLVFSAALLTILTAHEMGHYLACRCHGVAATLPFFIPAPPLFLAGTFGAFIKIKSSIPSRRALFDIGLAGPLAGFVVAVPIALVGILSMQPLVQGGGDGIVFNDPLLFHLLGRLVGTPLDPYAPINPYYMAAWIGLLVTSWNLMPAGTTRWRARNLSHVWPKGSQSYRSGCFRSNSGAGGAGIYLVREP